jgi:hypothetical protein
MGNELSINLPAYRESEKEKARTADLMAMIPEDCGNHALDIGARDGWFSLLLADKLDQVTALDLEMPSIEHPKIQCIKGDITQLDQDNDSYDLVFCAEVLEHIPPKLLVQACSELERVAGKYLIIGVPYKQDIRVARTTCAACGKKNPPWGHLNSFDERRLRQLFPSCDVEKMSFVGESRTATNALSVFLMDLAGNPYGQYDQEEPCIYCRTKLKKPSSRNLFEKICTKTAFTLNGLQKTLTRPHPYWIHLLLRKKGI